MNPVHILLIEDSPTDALLLESKFAEEKSFAYTLARAERLEAGLALLAGQTFDVVVSDLGLPDSQGLATFEALRLAAPHLPVILLTRYGDNETAVSAIKMGAQDYLPKGEFNGLLLCRTIRYAIERQQLVRQLETALAEVKTLSGLIPICAWCKNVRSDKGFWQSVEQYVHARTKATFTHGICPECAGKFMEKERQKFAVKTNPPSARIP